MNRLFITAFYVLAIGTILSCSMDNNILKKVSISEEIEPYTTGYVNTAGDTIIPIGKYIHCFTEEFDKIAIVSMKADPGLVAIDRNENVLFEVLVYDNSPDIIKNGLFRIRLNDKIGYANMDGEIIISAQFDGALPFDDGYARVCFGGEKVKYDEYHRHEGGKWGIIDTLGNYVVQPKYDEIKLPKERKVKVKQNNSWEIITF